MKETSDMRYPEFVQALQTEQELLRAEMARLTYLWDLTAEDLRIGRRRLAELEDAIFRLTQHDPSQN